LSDASNELARLLALMARLRNPQTGCEWDLAQDFATIAPYTIEEAFADVAKAIADKMEARHPHIFGQEPGTMTDTRWENLKAAERALGDKHSAMDGVAKALPALMRAQKLQKRAARDGFDWADVTGPESKISEEMEELRAASSETIEEEAGDFLFAAVNLVRAYGVDAEEALRRGNAKFERRYRAMEALADGKLADLSLEQQEVLWSEVKACE
jgi:nucleoside triphosphate diphosphatase